MSGAPYEQGPPPEPKSTEYGQRRALDAALNSPDSEGLSKLIAAYSEGEVYYTEPSKNHSIFYQYNFLVDAIFDAQILKRIEQNLDPKKTQLLAEFLIKNEGYGISSPRMDDEYNPISIYGALLGNTALGNAFRDVYNTQAAAVKLADAALKKSQTAPILLPPILGYNHNNLRSR